MAESLYDNDRRLEGALAAVRKSPHLTARSKELIPAYKDEMLANGISKGRAARFTYYMIKLGRWIDCEFEDADVPAMKRLVSRIEASEYVPFSKMEHKLALRKFYKWLRQSEDYPPEVKWVSLKVKASERIKLPEELLSKQDVQLLIASANTPRNRAFIATLYESGARISELALLKLKHVQFDSYGARLLVNGKTGYRSIRIISSVPFIKTWINIHPLKSDPDSYLWLTNRHTAPRYTSVLSLLTNTAKRAGIKKAVNPHIFRHSRATHLANHLTEAQMKKHFGWVRDSRMAAVYVHLSGRDVDNALLKLHGMKRDDTDTAEKKTAPKTCARCSTQNPFTNRFCSLCGQPLDKETGDRALQSDLERREADKVLDRMLENPAFKERFLEQLKDVLQGGERPAA